MELESDYIWQQEVLARKPAEKLAASGRQTEEASLFLAAVKPVRKKKQLQEFAFLSITYR